MVLPLVRGVMALQAERPDSPFILSPNLSSLSTEQQPAEARRAVTGREEAGAEKCQSDTKQQKKTMK